MTTLPEPFAIQYWSHQPITDELRAQLEEILEDTPAETSPIRQTKEGIWILTNDSHISKWIEETGRLDHDQNTLPLILPEIPVGGVVVDGGAFVGDWTVALLKRVGPTGRVIAFEPNAAAYECLLKNCPEAGSHCRALSDTTAQVHLRYGDNAGGSYLVDYKTDHEVITVRLDDFALERLDFLKLDVEGFELRALQGAEQTINRCRPVMVIEINDSALARQGVNKTEVYDWLRAHGYQWMPVQELLVADPPQYDILARPINLSMESHQPPENESTEPVDHAGTTRRGDSMSQAIGVADVPFTSARYLMEDGKYKEVPVPWANKNESLKYIDQLAAELKKFCTAPRSTLVVRECLKKARVINKLR